MPKSRGLNSVPPGYHIARSNSGSNLKGLAGNGMTRQRAKNNQQYNKTG
ncbi:hypothetical protein [Arsenophonus endosymbiont of Aleurodicus floccissimus]|nr:hypothetical protein [Arsenophonus endosymbiont of Aleurodicus floccissimus]